MSIVLFSFYQLKAEGHREEKIMTSIEDLVSILLDTFAERNRVLLEWESSPRWTETGDASCGRH